MSARGPSGFYVQLGPSGTLLLRGELDMGTVQDLQDKIAEIIAPGTPIILDLAQVSFVDSSAIHCFLKTWREWSPSRAAEYVAQRSPRFGSSDARGRGVGV